ncbi:hypothetical protein B0H11DRAFT_1932563 [Mycena galericulata]|nr:hypothetical protein B0H11DRAFT_1932563 [Mycena galericulata]
MTDMDALRTDLIHDSYYLGVAAVREVVLWRRIDLADLLVTKDSAEKVDEAARIAKTRKAEGQHNNGDTDHAEPAEILMPDPAFLTFVALISGPAKSSPTLADAKATCRMVAPELPPFASDFSEVLHNVKWFMQQCATAGNAKQGIFSEKKNPVLSIKLRHVLFEETEGNIGKLSIHSGLEGSHTMTLSGRLGRNEKHPLHHPLPAYNMKGNLIRATDYHRMIMGAVVRAMVTLRHWNIAPKENEISGRNTYTADILGLWVIVPAPKLPATPKSGGSKRRIFATDPGSLSKKARIGY